MSTFIEKHTFSFTGIYGKFIELQPSVYFFQLIIDRNFFIFAGKFIQAEIDRSVTCNYTAMLFKILELLYFVCIVIQSQKRANFYLSVTSYLIK